MTLKQGVLIFLLGSVAGISATCWRTNRQIVALKQAAADSTKIAQARDSAVTHYADSLKGQVDSLQKSKQPRIVKITQDSALVVLADSALKVAQDKADSI